VHLQFGGRVDATRVLRQRTDDEIRRDADDLLVITRLTKLGTVKADTFGQLRDATWKGADEKIEPKLSISRFSSSVWRLGRAGRIGYHRVTRADRRSYDDEMRPITLTAL